MAEWHISMVSVALDLGARAFAGKTDKTGREGAFLHSMRVYDAVKKSGGGEVVCSAALLHDVIEDTPTTVASLRAAFAAYPEETVEKMIAAVLSVTRGYIYRDSHTLVFEPPASEFVCDCEFKHKCENPDHLYKKETYRDFIMRSKRNPLGRAIKIADITDNMSPERVAGLPEDEKGIVEERYTPALAFLKDNKATEYFTPRQLARLCRWCSQSFSTHTGLDRRCPSGLLFNDPQRNKFKGVK
jgi:(p)ppGpp synthase/HD superfamily hydrolase